MLRKEKGVLYTESRYDVENVFYQTWILIEDQYAEFSQLENGIDLKFLMELSNVLVSRKSFDFDPYISVFALVL